MKMEAIIIALLALVAITGRAQTPKDSCSIPENSLRQKEQSSPIL